MTDTHKKRKKYSDDLSVDSIRSLFLYDGLNLIWKKRAGKTPDDARFNTRRAGNVAGSLTNYGYLKVTMKVGAKIKCYQVHRLIWAHVYGKWPEKHIDHINMVKTDNRIENLREADQAQNGWNRRMGAKNKTGYRGVKYDPRYKTYTASMKVRRKYVHIGTFKTVEEAAEAYRVTSKKYYGEFARPS